MTRLAILSPHRDDAVFSLALALRHWSNQQLSLRAINCFTRSGYAPLINTAGLAQSHALGLASRERRREDRAALRFVAPALRQIYDLGLLDAPLRPGIEFSAICAQDPTAVAHQPLMCELSRRITALTRHSLVLAPLGIGNHIDHLLVRAAAIAVIPASRLAFYEDLPYACWVKGNAIDPRYQDLTPALIRSPECLGFKIKSAARYRTQITLENAREIAGFSRRYGCAERIWIPRHSRPWLKLALNLP